MGEREERSRRERSRSRSRERRGDGDRDRAERADRHRDRDRDRDRDRGHGLDRHRHSDRADHEDQSKRHRTSNFDRPSRFDQPTGAGAGAAHGRSPPKPKSKGLEMFRPEPMPAEQALPPPVLDPQEEAMRYLAEGGGAPYPGDAGDGQEEEIEKEEANFGLSGKLAAETNTVRGVTLRHHEPPEACKPTTRWRLYIFKNGEPLPNPLYIHRQSCYLFGRERKVADIPTDHPSCSKQHAVLQYRKTEKEGPDGMMHAKCRPYIMDLGTVNGTFINGEQIEASRFYELLEKDMLKFGNSSREYILLHDQSSSGEA